MLRIGLGYDIHSLHPGHGLVLAGVEVPYDRGFNVYSDGDVVSHALVDAITGALAEGDIADHFSDKDPQNKDIRSLLYLVRLRPLLARRRAKVVNLDCVIEAEAPKLKPYFPAMRRTLADALQVTIEQVSIKGKTSEGLGYIGRSEAIAARAVVLLDLKA